MEIFYHLSKLIKTYQVVQIVLLLIVAIGSSDGASIQCSRPSNQTLQEQHSQLNHGVLLPPIDRKTISVDFVTHIDLTIPPACPSTPSSGADDPLEARSLCPWYYVINHDPTRYPTSMAEAKCKCNKCIKNDLSYCEEVKYNMQVLQQTDRCKDGYYVYEQVWMELTVGCTCAMPRTETGDPIDDYAPEI